MLIRLNEERLVGKRVYPADALIEVPDDVGKAWIKRDIATQDSHGKKAEQSIEQSGKPDSGQSGASVDVLELSPKVIHILKEHGLTTVQSVREMTDLTKLNGIGPSMSRSIQAALNKIQN